MRTTSSFQEAYRATLVEIRENGCVVPGVTDPTSVGSNFGRTIRSTRELLADGFCLRQPRSRLLERKTRPINPTFLAANVIWTIAGGHDVGMIATYNSRGRDFAKDQAYFEASFGARLFSPGQQLRYVERRLRNDLQSRRGTAVIYTPEDTLVDRLDVPCALVLQFIIRDQKLHCITIMRSQSAAMVMPYDVFLFTMIHEILAVRLDLDLGSYYCVAASMHYYDDEAKIVEDILSEEVTQQRLMPPILDASDKTLSDLVNAEQYLRLSSRDGRSDGELPMEAFSLDTYWREFLKPISAFHAGDTYLPSNWWATVP